SAENVRRCLLIRHLSHGEDFRLNRCPGSVDHYKRHRNGSPLGGSESAVFRSFLHLLLNYVYVTISSSKKDCSYIIYKFSLLVFPRAVLFGGFLRGRFLLGR
ncbi:MAG: hypothetical protein E6Y32_31430, partial [Pseudomonas aeruginosa]|nr:hypothetical protein [Pseudomonas aeruginosa]